MTVHVTRRDGEVDEFQRFGDSYIKRADGSLAVIRAGTMPPRSYGADQWTSVTGDERRTRNRAFWRRF